MTSQVLVTLKYEVKTEDDHTPEQADEIVKRCALVWVHKEIDGRGKIVGKYGAKCIDVKISRSRP